MDPICASIGVVTSVGSILSVLTKSISTLYNLRIRYVKAEQNIDLLIGQLQTVHAALSQVQSLAETLTIHNQHKQFVQQLHDSLHHCGRLVNILDSQIPEWNGKLKPQDKLIQLFDEQSTKDYLTRLDQQLQALNVCLNAFQW